MQSYKLKRYQRIIILIIVFLGMIYLNRNVLIYRNLINFLQTKKTSAVIISEKESMRKSHMTGEFTYYYEFEVNGKLYKNPSYNQKYKIGDSVKIVYALKYPFINKTIEE